MILQFPSNLDRSQYGQPAVLFTLLNLTICIFGDLLVPNGNRVQGVTSGAYSSSWCSMPCLMASTNHWPCFCLQYEVVLSLTTIWRSLFACPMLWFALIYLQHQNCMLGQCIDLPLHAVPWFLYSDRPANCGQWTVHFCRYQCYKPKSLITRLRWLRKSESKLFARVAS